MWVEPDLNMPDGESLVRQLLVGKRYFQKAIRRRRPHRLEPRLLRLQLAAPADLQALRHRLLRHPEDALERHQPAPLQTLLVAVARRQQGPHLLPHRLRPRQRQPHPHLRRLRRVRPARPRHLRDDATSTASATTAAAPPAPCSTRATTGSTPANRTSCPPCATAPRKATSPTSKETSTPRLARLGTTTPSPRATRSPAASTAAIGLPTWNDELYFEYHRGVFTTQAAAQTQHARERSLRPSTPKNYASLAWLDGSPTPPTQLTEAGKKSPSTNSTISPPAPASASSTKTRRRTTTKVHFDHQRSHLGRARTTLAARIDTRATAGDVPVLVFNPLAWRSHRRHRLFRPDCPTPPMTASPFSTPSNQPPPSRCSPPTPPPTPFTLLVEPKSVPSLGYTLLHVVPGQSRCSISDLTATRHCTLAKFRAPCRSRSQDRLHHQPLSTSSPTSNPSPPAPAATSSRPSRTPQSSTTPGTSTPAPSTT